MPAAALMERETAAPMRDYSRSDPNKIPKGGLYGLEVGGRLKQRRLSLGLKHDDVAERSNGAFARVAYTNYENGAVVPGPEKIFTLAEVLETTAKWLYFGDDSDLVGNTTVHQHEFKSGRWGDSGRMWGLNRTWLSKTFPQVEEVVCAEIEHSETPLYYAGDVALVEAQVKPSAEKKEEFIYSHAGAVFVGDVRKVAGGYELFDAKGKTKGTYTGNQVKFLGRAVGTIASVLEPA